MPFTDALVDERSAVVSAMPRQSFVSVRQLRRNFDDGSEEGLLKGTPDGIINRVQIRAIRWSYAGGVLRWGQRAQPPKFVAGPQIFEGFPFCITDIVFVMTRRAPGASPLEF